MKKPGSEPPGHRRDDLAVNSTNSSAFKPIYPSGLTRRTGRPIPCSRSRDGRTDTIFCAACSCRGVVAAFLSTHVVSLSSALSISMARQGGEDRPITRRRGLASVADHKFVRPIIFTSPTVAGTHYVYRSFLRTSLKKKPRGQPRGPLLKIPGQPGRRAPHTDSLVS